MDFRARAKVHGLSDDGFGEVHDNQTVADTDQEETNGGPNHLQAWRKFRRLTQQALADKVVPPTTKQVIAALESGQNGLSAKWLRRLAPALDTTPGLLLDHNPNDLDARWTETTGSVPPERREEAMQILQVLTGPKK